MPYAPGVQDISGQLKAQGRLAGGQALLGGFSAGIQEYNKNKLQNGLLNAENESLIAGLEQMRQMSGGKDISPVAPAGMTKLIDKHLQGGGLTLKESMQLNAMLNTTAKTLQAGQQMQQRQMQTALVGEQIKAMAQQNQIQANEVEAYNKTLAELLSMGRDTEGKIDMENVFETAARNKLSADGLAKLNKTIKELQGEPEFKASSYEVDMPGGGKLPVVQTSKGAVQVMQPERGVSPTAGERDMENRQRKLGEAEALYRKGDKSGALKVLRAMGQETIRGIPISMADLPEFFGDEESKTKVETPVIPAPRKSRFEIVK